VGRQDGQTQRAREREAALAPPAMAGVASRTHDDGRRAADRAARLR
jgi:hypothetical protein